jgi:hypothetical protein
VYKLCKHKICGGSAPAPPAETAVSALCVRILSTLIRIFASLFAKSEWVSGRSPENLKKEKKTCFAHSLQMSVFKKWRGSGWNPEKSKFNRMIISDESFVDPFLSYVLQGLLPDDTRCR